MRSFVSKTGEKKIRFKSSDFVIIYRLVDISFVIFTFVFVLDEIVIIYVNYEEFKSVISNLSDGGWNGMYKRYPEIENN